jgi:CRISPR/Cas system CSM-associated protein Csm3 (group 7 of RAMP superfamily)
MSTLAASRGAYLVRITCPLTFPGPVHVGTGQALALTTDAPVLRDTAGTPYIPGASVRGVLRDWSAREAARLGVDADGLARLFGETPDARHPDRPDRQGRLTVLDIPLRSGREQIRDHVRLHPGRGSAARAGKFDRELTHRANGELVLLYEGDSSADPELALLSDAVQALTDGLLAFGAASSTGLGVPGVAGGTIACEQHDRTRPAELAAYLRRRLTQTATAPRAVALLSGPALPPRSVVGSDPPPFSWLKLTVALQFDGPFLTQGPDRERIEEDAAPLIAPDGRPVLAGSGLRGVLRAHARRIARALEVPSLEHTLFGATSDEKPCRGLLRVGEGTLTGACPEIVLDHVAIDRLTGFASDAKLFNTRALASPRFAHELLIRWHEHRPEHHRALMLLLFVLRDAERGLLWAGSRTTRGYGHIKHLRLEAARGSRCATDEQQLPTRTEITPASRHTIAELSSALTHATDAWSKLPVLCHAG